ncbi:hypothetical protein [Microbacterium trichothecenolyticum]|uniref:Uncharacterized protein n=1 Tax=Microbacterium trichothecenolyticum TaxID=69370 RepID=A0A0M2HF47_MICTR|nr:hypothetical protein [Microbacterium trichothecenolyticum]KJL45268.1 hypothetical protein RS82_00298 [Microbacterium trichothecenolyticum]
MPRIRPSLIVLAAAAVALVGCASGPQSLTPSEIVAEIACASTDPLGGDPGRAGPMPDHFEPVAAVRCVPFQTVEDDEGIWSVILRERLEGDLTALLRAQAEPDDARSPGPCAAIAIIAPQIWLTDAAGRGIRVRYPADGCSQPKLDLIGDALAELAVVQTDEEQRTLTQPRAALESGCAPTWSARPLQIAAPEELEEWEGTLDAPAPAPSSTGIQTIPWAPPRTPAPGEVETLRLCAYSTDDAANPSATPAPGSTTWVTVDAEGTAWFTGSRQLDAAETRAVLGAAASAQPLPEACDDIPGSLVVLDADEEGKAPITVELDGCRRLIVDHIATYAAPPALVEMLGG